mgnify:CR=1 FL=1
MGFVDSRNDWVAIACSNTYHIETESRPVVSINTIDKKKGPRNFLIIYQSSFFIIFFELIAEPFYFSTP